MIHRVQSGQFLGNYRLLHQLGAGGFAEVYLGEHRYLNHRVAIKILSIPLGTKESDKFLQEARTMASLKHPHIVSCTDFGVEQGIPFLVMDYVAGGTLRNRYPDGSIVPLSEVISTVGQVAEALQYAHNQGVIHLDVKPENMLLDADGKVLLSDFGISRLTKSITGPKKMTSLIGTVGYMAPEFLNYDPQAATDQYALAMVAYEWLAGTLPFSGQSEHAVIQQQMGTPPPSLRDYDPSLPVAVDTVVRAALSKRPEERYPSVSEFAQALRLSSTAPADVPVDLDLVPEKPETLYKEGLKARGQGHLELAEQLLSTLQQRSPTFRKEIVEEQLQQIRRERRPQLLAQYRAEADAASEVGAWDQEIAALQRLLQLNPGPLEARQARERIRLAGQHQQYDHLYQDAQQMIAEGNKDGARLALQQLWHKDKYYGDPEGLARQVKKVSVPFTYQQEQLQIQRERTRQDREIDAEHRSTEHSTFREQAFGPQLHHQWLVCCTWFLYLTGISATLGTLTQSWLIALAALVGASVLGWFLGYGKALDRIPLAITSVVSLVVTLGLTLLLARLNYTHPISVPYTVSISTGFFSSKDITEYHLLFLGRQLTVGLISGAITALVAVCIAVIMRPPWGKEERPSPYASLYAFRRLASSSASEHLTVKNVIWIFLGVWLIGAGLTALLAAVAAMGGWGFGWDVGGNVMLLGFLLGNAAGVGLGASLPIWWTRFTS